MDLDSLTAELDTTLADADAALARDYPGERAGRQPVHTVYVPADRYGEHTVRDLGHDADTLVLQHAEAFLSVIDDDEDLLARVLAKLGDEPVEDLRIDFEDGYGNRPDAEEDATALAAADEVAMGLADLFVTRVLDRAGRLPERFVITVPKVQIPEQVSAFVDLLDEYEAARGLPDGTLRIEIQVETPQSILGADGTALVARMIHAADGRCTGLHYGTYDYSAFCGISAGQQSLEHPVADHAKAVMQAAAAGTGVRISDGSTNRLPVGDVESITAGWREHLRLVRRSLERGFYQGWDLHAGQLPTRYAATYAFFREGFPAAAERLAAYLDKTEGAIQDEPATARALSDFVLRGLDCGAISDEDVKQACGLERKRLLSLAGRSA